VLIDFQAASPLAHIEDGEIAPIVVGTVHLAAKPDDRLSNGPPRFEIAPRV
jgi:hypothetical protein